MDSSLSKNTVFSMLYRCVNVVAPLITFIYLSRVLMPDGVGRVQYAKTMVSIFVFIAQLGVPSYGVRVIASARNSTDPNAMNRVFSELMVILLSAAGIAFAIFTFLVTHIPNFQRNQLLFWIMGSQILLIPFQLDWFYQGQEQFGYIATRNLVIKVLAVSAVILFVQRENGDVTYAVITVLAYAGNYFLNLAHSRKFVRFTLRDIRPIRHWKPVMILLLSTIALELYSKIDVTMLEAFCGDFTVGIYTNAMKSIETILFAVTAISSVILPRLSLYYYTDSEEFSDLVNKAIMLVLFLSVPTSAILAIAAPDVVAVLFGEAFANTAAVLRVLTMLVIIKGISDIMNQVLIAAHKEKFFLISTGCATIINIILNSFLIRTWQECGAAVASVISELIVCCGLLLYSRKLFHLRLQKGFLLKIFTVTGVMAFCAFEVSMIRYSSFIRMLLSMLCGLSAFAMSYFWLNPRNVGKL